MTRSQTFRHYLLSCGLLLLPASLWNLALTEYLPPPFAVGEFWRDIPGPLVRIENGSRIAVFALPFCMPLETSSPAVRRGLLVFAMGTMVYFGSWLALILAPASGWATSWFGFVAPAYTPALWLFGIALTGKRLYWGRFYRWWMYLPVAFLFLCAHIAHTALVFARTWA